MNNSRAISSIYLADGYGLKIYVERGHLVVHDGIGSRRRTERFHRATSGLGRLVVIGHEGFVTLEALRWLRDTGAAFVHLDRDATLVTVTAAERLHESRLRRAQARASETVEGRAAIVTLLETKLERQASIAERRLWRFKAEIVRQHKDRIGIAEAIREQATKLRDADSFGELRKLESIAGRYYWQAWARVPIQLKACWQADAPQHWYRAGPRSSRMDKSWPRRALTPAHAMLNYLYAILESEAVLAAYKVGLDPSLGLMHADVRYRTSLATDLMEPARPVADELILGLLAERELDRRDVCETREGVCRLRAPLTGVLAQFGLALRDAVIPHAEQLARVLSRSTRQPAK